MTSGLMHAARSLGLVFFAAAALVLAGCASTGSSTSGRDAAATVTGTWTYNASGAQPLSRGTLQLATNNGRLVGQLRDSELGTIPIDARMLGGRLELRMDVFRFGLLSVQGAVQGDEFRGLVDRPDYDVSMNADRSSRRHAPALYGSFRAQRRSVPSVPALVLNCPKLGPDGLIACR